MTLTKIGYAEIHFFWVIVILVWEFYLGRTKQTRARSTVELLSAIAVWILVLVLKLLRKVKS